MNSAFLHSFGYAFKGLKHAMLTERNIRIQLFVAACVIVCGIGVGLSYLEWAIVLGCTALVIGLELMNTAIEKLVDLVQPNHDIRAGKIKDIAAGAVLWSAIVSAMIGLFIFIPKLILLIS